jgi:hypothetical protein
MTMGVDLKVCASHYRERRGEFLATASLRLDRDEALFAQLVSEATPCFFLTVRLPAGLVRCEASSLTC